MSTGALRKGFTMQKRYKSKEVDAVPGPVYAVGCSTLGIAAAEPMTRAQMTQVVVL